MPIIFPNVQRNWEKKRKKCKKYTGIFRRNILSNFKINFAGIFSFWGFPGNLPEISSKISLEIHLNNSLMMFLEISPGNLSQILSQNCPRMHLDHFFKKCCRKFSKNSLKNYTRDFFTNFTINSFRKSKMNCFRNSYFSSVTHPRRLQKIHPRIPSETPVDIYPTEIFSEHSKHFLRNSSVDSSKISQDFKRFFPKSL